MPIQYKVYGCKFKCGRWRRSGYKETEDHEKQCWNNPEVKSCITCVHGDVLYRVVEGVLADPRRICKHNRKAVLDGYKPITGCKMHELKRLSSL